MDATNSKSAGLLSLPIELRQQIYNHAIPISRLTPFPLGDAEWSMKTTEARGVPAILYASRQIYEEAAPLFYSRAILEVAPAQQGYNFWDVQIEGRMISHAYSRLMYTFRIYRAEHLRLVRRVHIFSNQTQAINGQCYEALLLWLVEHTSVENIQLSSRPMTRISGKASFDLPSWKAVFSDAVPRDASNLRLVRIWATKGRPPWEYEKIMRLRCKPSNGTLNPIQIYFCVPHGDGNAVDLQLDPRWLTRLSEEPEKVAAMEAAMPMIDRVMCEVLKGREAQNYKDNSRHFEGEAWLYQMILVPI